MLRKTTMDEVNTSITPTIHFATQTPNLFPPSSSQPSHELTFMVQFELRNLVTRRHLDLFGNNHLLATYEESQFGLQPRATFSLVEPSDQRCWDHQARSALTCLGIDPVFHDDVVAQLSSRVHDFAAALPTATSTRVGVFVDIKRHTVYQSRSTALLPRPTLNETFPYFDVLSIIDDYDNSLGSGFRANDNQEMASCVTERVDVNEWKTLQGKDCAVCLEQFQEVQLMGKSDILNHKSKDGDRAATRLLCKHVFHESCIMTWFKKSRLCPLCRRDCSQQASV